MGLFIESFMPGTADAPSVVTLILPGGKSFKALLNSEVSLSLSNKWGSLLPDVSALSDLSQLFNNQNVIAWIGASAQIWKATNPISLTLDLYLINYKPGLNYEDSLKDLTKLATMSPSDYTSSVGRTITAGIHGGYKPNVFLNNTQQFLGNERITSGNDGGLLTPLNTIGSAFSDSSEREGTITMKIGSHFRLNNLLLHRVDVHPSTVEVYSPSYGGNPKPLYYKVTVTLSTCRAALSTDIDGMFGG